MKALYFLFLGLLWVSCQQSPRKLTQPEKETFLALGDSITSEVQRVLLKNVSEQIAKGGTVRAVEFCNENAVSLTNSSRINTFEINRLSNKNRNPNNEIKSEIDQQAWNEISTLMNNTSLPKHLLKEQGESVYYYKAIPIGMPTCLACHGNEQTEITPETLQIITAKYPYDKATNYTMGELRGIWKVKLN